MTNLTSLPSRCHDLTRIVADYWASIHPAEVILPARRHFDPLDLPSAAWPFLILAEVLEDPFDMRFRLVGSEVVEFEGYDATGKKLSECPIPGDREAVVSDYRAVVEGRRLSFRQVQVHDKNRGYEVTVERTHFPLAENGRDVNMILTTFIRLERQTPPDYGSPTSSICA